MARSTSDEEVQLKKRARRRLVGAVVLATTVAVVLPMVLDTEPKPVSQNVNIQIPSPDSPGYAPRAAEPAPADAGKEGAAKTESTAVPKADSKDPAPVANEPPPAVPKAAETPKAEEPPKAAEKAQPASEPPKVAEKEAAKPVAKEPAKTEAKAAPSAPSKATDSGKYVVQLAALADSAKAKQLKQRVAGTGVKAYTEVVKTAKGNVTRVRAGPYDSREAAEKVRGRLKSAGLDGKVVPR